MIKKLWKRLFPGPIAGVFSLKSGRALRAPEPQAPPEQWLDFAGCVAATGLGGQWADPVFDAYADKWGVEILSE